MEPSNILKIESLNSEWRDKDRVLLHACFQVLKDCVEKENLFDCHVDWEHDQRHRDARKEITKLYQWWLKRVMEDDMVDSDEEKQFKTDTTMLVRLVNIRWALWT